MPTVSVIVPCYNIAQHLSKCIESILAQSYTNFELLLIDDGSTDGTLTVLQKYAETDQRIRIFTHENRGVSYTRNRGISEAKGEWIMFVDGDDYVKQDFLEQHLKFAEKEIWVISGMVNVHNGLNTENEYFRQLLNLYPDRKMPIDKVLSVLQYYSLSSPCCRVYSAEVIKLKHLQFNENVSYQEDLLFNLSYINHVRQIVLLTYFGYYYIQHGDSSSSKYHPNFDYIDDLFEKLTRWVKNSDDKLVVDEFILNTILKRLSNIFHRDSMYSRRQKIAEIRKIFKNKYFSSALAFIKTSALNPILKRILYHRMVYAVYFYFQKRVR